MPPKKENNFEMDLEKYVYHISNNTFANMLGISSPMLLITLLTLKTHFVICVFVNLKKEKEGKI